MSRRNHRRDLIRKMWRYAKWSAKDLATVSQTNMGYFIAKPGDAVKAAMGEMWKNRAYELQDQINQGRY